MGLLLWEKCLLQTSFFYIKMKAGVFFEVQILFVFETYSHKHLGALLALKALLIF